MVSQSTKDKISKTFKMKEIHQGENNPMYGKTHSEDSKQLISKSTTSTGVYRVSCVKDKRIKQGYCFIYIHSSANVEYQSINILSLKERVLDNGLDWIIVDEEKYIKVLQKNMEDIKKYPSRIGALGIQYVSKKTSSKVKQGFLYRYSLQSGDNKIDLTSTDINKLEKKVKDNGYDWVILDDAKSNALYEENEQLRKQYGR